MPKNPTSSTDRHLLSKTSFIKSIQCQKQLYLYKHKYFLRDKISFEQLAIFKRGHKIGKLAWELFPEGVYAGPKSPAQYQKSIINTKNLINDCTPIIYEAAFQYNQCMSILDILTVNESEIIAYEVKSSTSISETYLYDAAYQYYVMTSSGTRVDRFFVIYVNPTFVLTDSFSVDEYFKMVEVTEQIKALQIQIIEMVDLAKATVLSDNIPKVQIGNHCEQPYTCDFNGFCKKFISKPNVFLLSHLTKEEQYKLYLSGKIKIKDILPDDLSNSKAVQQLKLMQQNENVLLKNIHPEAFRCLQIGYFVFDKPAIPIVKGQTPYSQVLMAFFWKKWDDIEFNSLLFDENMDYGFFLKIVEKNMDEREIITFDNEGKMFFHKTERYSSIYDLFFENDVFIPALNGDYSFENVVDSLDEKKEHVKFGINNHEELKSDIYSSKGEPEKMKEEAKVYVNNRLNFIKKIWIYLHS